MRKPFIAGNWKMNMDSHTSVELITELAEGLSKIDRDKVDVAVIPPFVYLQAAVKAARSSHIAVGAQNMYFEQKGAFTGEISSYMLKDIGCSYVLCGHSERRHVMGEKDELINKKINAAIIGGLLPIFCVGELLEERESGKTNAVVERQIRAGFAGMNAAKAAAVTVAYEPVWAIGTGKTATPEQAQEVHAFIRGLLADIYDKDHAAAMRIQYGGSVKSDNAAQIMAKQDIDGLLVGGASLKAAEFLAIIKGSIK